MAAENDDKLLSLYAMSSRSDCAKVKSFVASFSPLFSLFYRSRRNASSSSEDINGLEQLNSTHHSSVALEHCCTVAFASG
jgi:hypothetical protein